VVSLTITARHACLILLHNRYQRFNSPYYKDTHKHWRERIRAFTEKEILPTMEDWKNKLVPPRDIYEKVHILED